MNYPHTTPGALEGIRVLDLSRVLAGPFCATILADLGAEVIKIETPWGDDSREFGPFWDEHSAYYRLFNRSKMGITLDLKTEEDKQIFLELVQRADVVIENFRPGVMDRLGISADTLQKLNPRLIVTSISGFGQTGSMAKYPAYDLVAQAMSGLMSITGSPSEGPTRTGVSLGDIIPGLYAAIATLGAVLERNHTDRGQHADIAMFDSLVSVLESVAMRDLYEEEIPTAVGNDHAMTVPFSTYHAADGEVVIAVSNETLFKRLTAALDIDFMLQDPRYSTNSARVKYRQDVRRILEEKLSLLTVQEAVSLLQEHGVPTSRVFDVHEAITGELAQERGVLIQESDGFTTLASPIKLEGSIQPKPAPGLGEHNSNISTWLEEPLRTTVKPQIFEPVGSNTIRKVPNE